MILDDILAHKRREVAERMKARPLAQVANAADRAAPCREFVQAIASPGLNVIAELKRVSPARGPLNPSADAGEVAKSYQEAGAAALSVLTDGRFFGGSDRDLRDVRAHSDLPALRKDFVVSEYQLYEARALGADAVLLIVRAISKAELAKFLALSSSLGMAALVEVHAQRELDIAIAAGANLVGINNRDLDTMRVDPQTTDRLRPSVPRGTLVVSESGVSTPQALARLAELEVNAVLMGEALMIAPNPGAKLRSLLALAGLQGAQRSVPA